MHLPELGSYPLTLRDHDISNPRLGELLLDYTNYELYYVNKSTSEKVSMAKDIYQRILKAKMQNTNFIRYDNTSHPSPVIDKNLSLEEGTVSGTTIKLRESRYTYAQYREPLDRYTLILDESSYIYPKIEDREYNTIYFVINSTSIVN